MQVRNIIAGLALGLSVLVVSYLVGTANNIDMNQMTAVSAHYMARVA